MPAAKIECPVAEAGELVHRALLIDRERRRVGVAEQLEVGDLELDLPGGEVGVDVVGLATRHGPDRRDHVLGPQVVGARVRLGGCLRVEDELQQAGAVAQVDEDQTAVVAAPVDPTGDTDLVAGAGAVDGPRPGVPVGVGGRRPHSGPRPRNTSRSTAAGSTSRCSPDSMSFSPPPPPNRIAPKRPPPRSACWSGPWSERPATSIWAPR